jgi:hypothetical protein
LEKDFSVAQSVVITMNIMWFRIIVFGVSAIVCIRAQGKPGDKAEMARKTAARWTWGVPTNGIVGGIYVSSQPLEYNTEYWVYVHEEFKVSVDSSPPTFYSEPNSNSLSYGWFLKKFGDTNPAGMFFKATNYFCGPVLLRDSNGVAVPARNPHLVSPSAYPQSFRQSELGQIDPFHAKFAVALAGRLPQLAKLNLRDLFDIKQPGDYILTVWPKIYRQLRSDDDLCERVDLLPISLKIHWTPPPAN